MVYFNSVRLLGAANAGHSYQETQERSLANVLASYCDHVVIILQLPLLLNQDC